MINTSIQLNSESDFKNHFVDWDNLNSLKHELIFSVLKKYNCYAKCKICYNRKHTINDRDEFAKFIPLDLSKEYDEKLSNVFDNYLSVALIDDLFNLKHNYPHLYNWYRDNFYRFDFESTTDNNFIRNFKILTEDAKDLKSIYELAFSDVWLEKVKLVDIIAKLDRVKSIFKIYQLKFIVSSVESMSSKSFIELKAWALTNNVRFRIYTNVNTLDTIDLGDHHQETSWASSNGDLFPIYSEANYLQYDSFYLSLKTASLPTTLPYDVIDDSFTIEKHVYKHISEKAINYRLYYEQLSSRKLNERTEKYKNYFQFISENLITNEAYNYIPSVSLDPENTFYQAFLKKGWTGTKFGLINTANQSTIVPLFSWKK